MVRKLLIIVAAVFAPLAFAGATSDISTSWVRKWIEAMIALIVSKLILVIVFVIGLGVLTDGLGEASPAGSVASASQSITQTIIGALILLMAGFAPWLAIKLIHFGGDHFHQLHGHAQATLAGRKALRPRLARPARCRQVPGVGWKWFRRPPSRSCRFVEPIPASGPDGSGPRGLRLALHSTSKCSARQWRIRHGQRHRCSSRPGQSVSLPGGASAAKTAVDKGTGHVARGCSIDRPHHAATADCRLRRRNSIDELAPASPGTKERHLAATNSCSSQGPTPVRFGRRSTRGLLLGLSGARCLSAGSAIVSRARFDGRWRNRTLASAWFGHPCWRPPMSPGRTCALRVGAQWSGIGWRARSHDRANSGPEFGTSAGGDRWPFPVTPLHCALRRPGKWGLHGA